MDYQRFPLCKSTVPRDCKSLKNSAAGLSSQQYYQLEFQTHQYRCHNRLREPQMQRGGQCSGGAGIIDDGVLSSATLLAGGQLYGLPCDYALASLLQF